METVALHPHKADSTPGCSLLARSSAASPPRCRNELFLPLRSVDTSHGQRQVPSQPDQTRPAVCPAIAVPDTLWGASHVCLKTTQPMQ